MSVLLLFFFVQHAELYDDHSQHNNQKDGGQCARTGSVAVLESGFIDFIHEDVGTVLRTAFGNQLHGSEQKHVRGSVGDNDEQHGPLDQREGNAEQSTEVPRAVQPGGLLDGSVMAATEIAMVTGR